MEDGVLQPGHRVGRVEEVADNLVFARLEEVAEVAALGADD